MHHASLDTRRSSSSLELSSRFVPGAEEDNGLQQGDSNLDLGVTVYFIEDGNQAVMYERQPVAELASTCIGMMQERGANGNEIVLSHKHQDHVEGLTSSQLNQVSVLAQDNTKTAPAQDGAMVPDETYTDFKALSVGATNINVTHF
ncbi:uncharacterized protein HRG_04351 [Hirsutella rhossiliensis]|uniref:Uncharacterized protein n=1 Tax=Hirsutella rhossiliensis TaxID=111463 RepID=A0A9P8MX50_9HYPO|nr:uncharacterized protein HRG_04351 [Hirsutella rhossiliensis]KAH0963923.1 hypothetical protein HRG_04351 [Hirsutella rhossiliensis]